ncbi:hypothetical protein HDU93_006191, partial [Gonapodya sp. JEL0774]
MSHRSDTSVLYTPIRGSPPPPASSGSQPSTLEDSLTASVNSAPSGPLQGWASTQQILRDWTQYLSGSSVEHRQQLPEHYAGSEPVGPGEKPIILPVRVEPKIVFANERTFLTWMHFGVVLTTLSVTLLNFADTVGQIAGLFFTVAATATLVYGLMLFLWRSQKIRNRDREPYDSVMGPTALMAVLFVGVFLNFALRLVEW